MTNELWAEGGPDPDETPSDASRASGKSLQGILFENIIRLVEAHQTKSGRRATMNSWTRDLGLDAKVLTRATGKRGLTLATVEQIAKGVGLQPWELLVEGLDPMFPPSSGKGLAPIAASPSPAPELAAPEPVPQAIESTFSPQATELALIHDSIVDHSLRDRAYAMATNVLESLAAADKRIREATTALTDGEFDAESPGA
jgi:hypothetical protein